MLQGIGLYVWQIPQTEAGNIEQIAAQAEAGKLSHLVIKLADGVNRYGVTDQGIDLAAQLVAALHARGITAYGWQYVYGIDPEDEAGLALKRIQQTGVDGFVIDAEKEYKGRNRAASTFMAALRKGYKGPVGLASYRYPSLHATLPWNEFMSRCDFNMPQVYWEQAHNADAQLMRCVREFEAMDYVLPIIPTGAAYKWNGWVPTVEDVTEFMDTARDLGLPGYNFWSWQHCRRDLPALWQLITGGKEPEAQKEHLALTYKPWRNCRKGPGTNYRTDGKILAGQDIYITQRVGAWGHMDDGRWILVSNGVKPI